jgi:molecular chaperone GrpE
MTKENETLENNEDLKKQLAEAEKQKEEYLAGWQRARADFLNYKKEEIERFKSIIDIANEEMILKILPLIDNLHLAEKSLPKDLKENQYIQGLLQIKAQLETFLRNQGVESLESMGKKFDPQFHEVIEQVESDEKSGTIVEENQKGYLINNRLLRPAKVKVSK